MPGYLDAGRAASPDVPLLDLALQARGRRGTASPGCWDRHASGPTVLVAVTGRCNGAATAVSATWVALVGNCHCRRRRPCNW